MKIIELELGGVRILVPKAFKDYRGYYMESYSSRTLKEYGIDIVFVQDNHSLTLKKGTIRGIHFQNAPKPQTKLVRCSQGSILDVVVDLRVNSPTYKKWVSFILTKENKKQIFIPRGYGHGCLSLVDDTEVQYKVDEFYYPEYDRTILWSDEELNIDWGINNPILSPKDANAPILKNSDVNFRMDNLL